MNGWKLLGAGLMIVGSSLAAGAQGFVDQDAVATVLETQTSAGLPPDPVHWHTYAFRKTDKTTKAALAHLQTHLDSLPGGMQGHRMDVVALSNRVCSKYMIQHQALIIPDSFPEDFRAYAPYPFRYEAAADLPKLFVIDKYSQTFGAYENGELVRWGLISSGHDDDLTPNGRYSFNWKQEYRESSEAPKGETWKMHWVFNFIEAKGIHVHQYQLPIANAASHGCVRLTESDAAWNFNWASEASGKQPGTPVIVINHNPAGLSAHWLTGDEGDPISLVNLPDDLNQVPGDGTNTVAGW